MRPALPARHAPYPACAKCHALPVPCANALPFPRATRPALPAPRALTCLRHAPCPASTPRALPCQRATRLAQPAPRALPCQPTTRPALPAPSALPSLCPLTCPVCSCCLHAPALPCAYRQLPLPPAHTPTVATTTAPTTAATTPTVPAIANVESLSPQQLCEWAIWWGSPGGGASRARWQQPYLPQQRREWAARWSATAGGTCESTPAGTAASKCGGFEGGQQQQQHPLETLCP
ncbi:unnamed protein product [Closterium sp. NIES-53]